jgi:CxxC-x17-CxxC domain-containing protein
MAEDRGFEKKMFQVVCSECGKDTEVPFKPDENRPVYCKECYQKRRPKRDRY